MFGARNSRGVLLARPGYTLMQSSSMLENFSCSPCSPWCASRTASRDIVRTGVRGGIAGLSAPATSPRVGPAVSLECGAVAPMEGRARVDFKIRNRVLPVFYHGVCVHRSLPPRRKREWPGGFRAALAARGTVRCWGNSGAVRRSAAAWAPWASGEVPLRKSLSSSEAGHHDYLLHTPRMRLERTLLHGIQPVGIRH